MNSISVAKEPPFDKPFTNQIFCKGIVDSLDQEEFSGIQNFIHIRRIVNFLFDYKNWKSGDYREASIESLKEDPILHTFAFFIQSNNDFCYNWSYLNSKLEGYIVFLNDFQSHIDYMVSDIETICKKINVPWDGIQLILEDCITLLLKSEKPYYLVKFAPQEFQRLIKFKKGKYHLTVKLHKTTVGNFDRYSKSDASHVAEKLNILLCNYKENQNEGKEHERE